MKKTLFAVLALVMALPWGFAHAGASGKTKKPKTYKKADFEALAKKVMDEGWEHSFRTGLAKDIGVPDRGPGWELGVVQADSEDGREHALDLVLDPESKEPRTLCLVFSVGSSNLEKLEREDYYFRIDPSGALEKFFVGRGKIDKDGHGIKGSGRSEFKNAKSSEAAKVLQYEYELWFEGKHRKKVPSNAGKE